MVSRYEYFQCSNKTLPISKLKIFGASHNTYTYLPTSRISLVKACSVDQTSNPIYSCARPRKNDSMINTRESKRKILRVMLSNSQSTWEEIWSVNANHRAFITNQHFVVFVWNWKNANGSTRRPRESASTLQHSTSSTKYYEPVGRPRANDKSCGACC